MCSICQRTTKINYFLGLKKEISSSSASLFSRIEVSCSHIIDECTILSAPCVFVAYVLLVPYMPHAPKCLTCLSTLLAHVPACVHAFASYIPSFFYVPYVPSFLYVDYVLLFFTSLRNLIFFVVPSFIYVLFVSSFF